MIGKVSGAVFFERYGEGLIKSYTALKIKFKFPITVKYPNLPVRLDLNSVIFPLEGETFCTGIEFVLAMNLNCEIEIQGGVFIPFKPTKNLDTQQEHQEQQEQKEFKEFKEVKEVKEIYVKDPQLNQMEIQIEKQIRNQLNIIEKDINNNNNNNNSNNNNNNINSLSVKGENENGNGNGTEYGTINSNFYSIVKELMLERLKYPKGSYMNLLYKFLANSGIGQMARGLNQKVRYDSQTNSTKILPSGDLVSPLYAG